LKLIAGFGNPGEKHVSYRCNIGFKILDVIANNAGIEIKTKKKKSLIGRGEFEGEDIVLLKPQTYVNLCGESVLYIASFLKIKAENIIIIHEDSNIQLGRIIVQRSTNQSDHPGVQSVKTALKSDQFICIRVGIDSDYLQQSSSPLEEDFTPEENTYLINIINDTEAALRAISIGNIDDVINTF
jgi:PTH1 family peptidyl-tRNA hydrolase